MSENVKKYIGIPVYFISVILLAIANVISDKLRIYYDINFYYEVSGFDFLFFRIDKEHLFSSISYGVTYILIGLFIGIFVFIRKDFFDRMSLIITLVVIAVFSLILWKIIPNQTFIDIFPESMMFAGVCAFKLITDKEEYVYM